MVEAGTLASLVNEPALAKSLAPTIGSIIYEKEGAILRILKVI